jgi:malonyl-CoA/methylmalonyl-CoA synthetase
MSHQHPHWLAGRRAHDLISLWQMQLISADRLWATGDDGRHFTYGQFWRVAGQMAQNLRSSGAKRGDRIAVQVDKSIEALALFWACVRGGFVFLPLNTAYTMSEVSYFLNDAEAHVFVTTPAKYADAVTVAYAVGCKRVFTLDEHGSGSLLESHNFDFEDVASNWDDIAAILYTSGTTGRSKGAMLSHGNLASNALALIDLWRFTPDDVLLHALPVYHTHGLFVGMNTVLLSGGRLLFHRRFDSDAVMQDMAKATCFMGVPTFYTRLLQHPELNRATTQHIRLFVSGSAPLLAETHKAFEIQTGHGILERYGMTETNMIASNPYDAARRAGTVGFALPHVEVRITDPQSAAELPREQDGMIEVKGPNVFEGYWRNPEKTREDKRDDGFFITGDLGRIDEQGYLVISGRAKDLIITGGFNVYPKEIEEAIDALAGVNESAVIGLPHADFGEAVTAIIATDNDLDETHVIAALKTKLAAFKTPKRVLCVKDLPRNAMGKVQKAELRKRFAGLYSVVPG